MGAFNEVVYIIHAPIGTVLGVLRPGEIYVDWFVCKLITVFAFG